jgi:hypothetical protein
LQIASVRGRDDDAIALVEEELARAALAGKREDGERSGRNWRRSARSWPTRPGDPLEWLTRARDRISAVGVRLHEIEER